MRIHTIIESSQPIRDALTEQKNLGRIASHVSFKTLDEHRSKSAPHAFEIQLEAGERDNGRRAGNSGSYGAMRAEHDGYAATYDEWGWLLAALYTLDPEMIVGSPKKPTYDGAEDFHTRTAWTYDPERWLAHVNEWPSFADERDPFPWITGRAAKTKRGFTIGRRGADRLADPGRWVRLCKEQPRTVAEVRAFAYPLGTLPDLPPGDDGTPLNDDVPAPGADDRDDDRIED